MTYDDRAFALLNSAGVLGLRYRVSLECCDHEVGETFAPSYGEAIEQKRNHERPVEGHTRKATVMIL